jgi:uncharacterized membrane protein HdeD (DUF308 family)
VSTQEITDEIHKRAGWSIFMGVLTAALGVFLVVYPMATATLTTVLLGWILLLVGIAQFIFALNSTSVGSFFLKIALSLLYGIAGIALVAFPILGMAALTGIVGGFLLVQAVLQTVAAFQLRPAHGWGWVLSDGLASALLGILILRGWPSSSVWAIGTLVGASVFVGGIGRIVLASSIRAGTRHGHHLVQGAA